VTEINKQQLAIDAAKRGKNVCMLAAGGFGKSWAVNQMISDDSIIVCPTSVAARNVNGETAHSVFSLSHGIQTEKDRNRITSNMRMLFDAPIDMIVLDEAFNFRADLLDDIDYKLKLIRGSDKPFGGIQLVLSGDCLQNAPIVSPEESRYFSRKYKSPFIFDSKIWNELSPEVFVLDKSYRNENVEQLIMLNAIRTKDISILDGYSKPLWMEAIDYMNDIAKHGCYTPETDLYTCVYKKDAEAINMREYGRIDSPEFVYNGVVKSSFHKSDMLVPQELKLKVGTKVMFCVNNKDCGYYNGLQGVVSYLDKNTVMVTSEDGGDIIVEANEWENTKLSRMNGKLKKSKMGTYTQYPLLKSYAATISKIQGLTLNNMTMNLGKDSFGQGMLYVGLSRLRDLKNLTLVRPIAYNDLKVNQKALNFVNLHK